jgi:PKD repeat protein
MNIPLRVAIFCVISWGLSLNAFAQSQGHACIQGLGMGNQQIWWTGSNNGKYLMDFSGGGAPILSNAGIGQTGSFEGTAVYTTPDGSLLLYTDGNEIFNGQTHASIGTGVGGNPSATEAALIVPDPAGDPTNDFYVFGNTTNVSGNVVNFTLVDIGGNSIGAVTPLGGGVLFGESLATVPHANGTDFWVMSVTSATPTLNAYLVSGSGVSGTAVSSAIPGLPANTSANRGSVIYHPPTGRLAISFYSNSSGTGYIFTAQFDEATGTVSGFTQVATGQVGYGVAFSPDAGNLYYSVGTEGWSGSITHYDVGTATATTIQAGSWAMPRLGPDGKVYVVAQGASTMGVINAPDNAFASIDWNPTGIALPAGSTAAYGLVNQTFAPCLILNPNLPPIASFTFSCSQLECTLDGRASSDPDGVITSWSWDFGDGQGGSGDSILHTYGAAGSYAVSLTVTDDGGATDQLTRTVNVAVAAPPSPSEAIPVPMLGHWKLMLLALLLGVSGVLYVRRSG